MNFYPKIYFCAICNHMHVSFPLRFPKSGNEDLALSLTQWVFKEKGVLRVGAVKHNKQGEKEPPQAYTVFDMVVSRSVPTEPQFLSLKQNMGYILNETGKPLLDFTIKRLCLLIIFFVFGPVRRIT